MFIGMSAINISINDERFARLPFAFTRRDMYLNYYYQSQNYCHQFGRHPKYKAAK